MAGWKKKLLKLKLIKLKGILVDDKVKLPLRVKERYKEYRKSGEMLLHFFCRIEYKSNFYYILQFLPNNELLVVREDGEIPKITDIINFSYDDVVWMSKQVDTNAQMIEKVGKKWAYVSISIPEKVLRSLEKLVSHLQPLPSDIQRLHDSFYNVTKGFIERTKLIREGYIRGKEIVDYLSDSYTLNLALSRELERHANQVLHNVFKRNWIQVETFEDRKQFLRYLRSQIPFYRLGLWWHYLVLHWWHRQLWSNKLSKQDAENFDMMREEIEEGNMVGRKGFYEEIIPLIRNPK